MLGLHGLACASVSSLTAALFVWQTAVAAELPILGIWGNDITCFGYHRTRPPFPPVRVSKLPWQEDHSDGGIFQCRYTSFEPLRKNEWLASRVCEGGLFGMSFRVQNRIELLSDEHISVRTGTKRHWSGPGGLHDADRKFNTRIEDQISEVFVGLRRCDENDISTSIGHHFPPKSIKWDTKARTAQAIYLLKYIEYAAAVCELRFDGNTHSAAIARIKAGLNDLTITTQAVRELQNWANEDYRNDSAVNRFCQLLYDRVGPTGTLLPSLVQYNSRYGGKT